MGWIARLFSSNTKPHVEEKRKVTEITEQRILTRFPITSPLIGSVRYGDAMFRLLDLSGSGLSLGLDTAVESASCAHIFPLGEKVEVTLELLGVLHTGSIYKVRQKDKIAGFRLCEDLQEALGPLLYWMALGHAMVQLSPEALREHFQNALWVCFRGPAQSELNFCCCAFHAVEELELIFSRSGALCALTFEQGLLRTFLTMGKELSCDKAEPLAALDKDILRFSILILLGVVTKQQNMSFAQALNEFTIFLAKEFRKSF